jgi:hypothetical protein
MSFKFPSGKISPDLAGAEQAAEKLNKRGSTWENFPQGLKPRLVLPALSARMNPCPFKTSASTKFFGKL